MELILLRKLRNSTINIPLLVQIFLIVTYIISIWVPKVIFFKKSNQNCIFNCIIQLKKEKNFLCMLKYNIGTVHKRRIIWVKNIKRIKEYGRKKYIGKNIVFYIQRYV